MATNGFEVVVDAHWRYFLPCTTGSLHVAQYYVESPDFVSQDTQHVRIAWYAKEIQVRVILIFHKFTCSFLCQRKKGGGGGHV